MGGARRGLRRARGRRDFVVKGTSGGVSDFTQNFTLPFKALVPAVVRDFRPMSRTHLGMYDFNLTGTTVHVLTIRAPNGQPFAVTGQAASYNVSYASNFPQAGYHIAG